MADMISRRILAALLLFCVSVFSQSPSTQSVRELLNSPTLRVSEEALKKLFPMGTRNIPQYVAALSDSDEEVSDNAQYMIELIGDRQGLEQLDAWRNGQRFRRFVNGPINAPVDSQGYQWIDERFLQLPYEQWDAHVRATNYAFALVIDGSPKARLTLERMQEAVPESASYSNLYKVLTSGSNFLQPMCAADSIEKQILRRSVFLGSEEKKRTYVVVIAKGLDGKSALVREWQDFGYTYMMVLDRQPSRCWKFRSIFVASINN